jgi:hypothetical protein
MKFTASKMSLTLMGVVVCLVSQNNLPMGSSFVMPTPAIRRIVSSNIVLDRTPTILYSSSVPGSDGQASGVEGDHPGPADITEENIRSLFALFNNALAT